ncbi:MAG: hypothetical protein ABSA23_00645 [Anaerolineales bacterium]|jgi:hypothetical protein
MISELVPAGSGPVFLARLEPLLTVLDGADILTVMRYADWGRSLDSRILREIHPQAI